MYSLEARRRQSARNKKAAYIILSVGIGAVTVASAWVVMFMTGAVTLGGVPYSVVMKFWQDAASREAYFSGDGRALHNRLGELGIEYEIKKYYRSQISDPIELDQHIHQILYDRTGYLGNNYIVQNRQLVLKEGRAAEIENCPTC